MNPPAPRFPSISAALALVAFGCMPARTEAIDFSGNGAEIQIGQETTGAQWTPRLARLTDGRVVVVWDDKSYIKARIFNADSSPASLEFLVDGTPNVSIQNFTPDVAALPGGGFVVTWQGYINSTRFTDIFARVFDNEFNPIGATFLVNDETTGPQNQPQAEVFNDGTILFAWQHDSGVPNRWDIKYRLFHPDLSPVETEQHLATVQTANQFQVEFTRLGDGSVVAAWETEETAGQTPRDVKARRIGTAGALGDEITVNTSGTGDQYDPSVAALGAAGFVVAWAHDEVVGDVAKERGEIRFQRFTFNSSTDVITPAGSETEVNTVTAGSQIEPSVSGWNGGFVVTWTSENNLRSPNDTDIATGEDGSGAGVYARGYDADGVAQAPPFRLNVTVQNHQYQATTAALNGFAMVAWTSKGQDGDNDGVYLRRIQTDSSFVPADPDAGGTTMIPVPPTLSMTGPAALVFKADKKGKLPPGKFFQIRNTGDSPLTWATTKSSWLHVSPGAGTLAADGVIQVRITALRAKLPKRGNKIRGSVTFDATGSGTGDRTIRVLVQRSKANR